MVDRTVFFVDGFNLWHSIDNNPTLENPGQLKKYKWLNLRRLAECFVPTDQISGIYYFSALATWNKDKVDRHQTYISALKTIGVKIILGNFKVRDKKCYVCGKVYQTHEEKQTDVNIAVNLFKSAVKDEYDTAIIVSGDTDLVPAIESVKEIYPSKKIGVMLPVGRRANLLIQMADFKMKIRESHLARSQFPDNLQLDGLIIKKPERWNLSA